jgi:ribose 5-phosphate isomerase B
MEQRMADEDERVRLERMVAIACDSRGLCPQGSLKVALPDVKWLDLGTNSADSVEVFLSTKIRRRSPSKVRR